MTRDDLRTLVVGCALACLAACGEQDDALQEGRRFMEPVAFNDKLLFVSETDASARILDVSRDELSARTREVELPANPRGVFRRQGDHDETDEILVLSDGVLGDASETSEPAALSIVDDDGRLRTFELPNPFDAIWQSEDGRYVILQRTGNNNRLLGNNSQIAVVDLEEADDEAALTLRDLGNLGAAPTRVFFSPAMEIAGEERRLAVIFADRDIALLDLSHPERDETAVALTSDVSRALTPRQVLFDPNEARIFVLASGSNDIFVLRLNGPIDNPGGNDFRPTIDLLEAGENPQHMTLFEQSGLVRLLVAAPGRSQVVVVEVDSSRSITVPMPNAVQQSLVFQLAPGDEDPEGEEDEEDPAPVALLWAPGNERVLFLNLANIEARGERNLDTGTRISDGIDSIIELPNEDRVVITHAGGSGLSLLDLATRTVTPISSSQPLGNALFDIEGRRIWVAPEGQRSVAYLDLTTGATEQMILDENVQRFVPLFGTGKAAVVHASPAGHVTVLDADRPRRETARSVYGFFIADLLD